MIIIFGCVVVAVVFHLWNLKVWKLYCLSDLFFLCSCLLTLFIRVHAVSVQQTRFLLIFMQMLFCETAFFFLAIIHSDIKNINNTFLN